MRCNILAMGVLPAMAAAINIVQSNDDGWAEINIRQFYDALTSSGYSSIVSAPAENQSGTGSRDAPPTTVDSDGCEFSSCPGGSPPTGNNASMPRLNYVNSYPATSMEWGIQTLSPEFFGGPPDLAVAGPNVGANLGIVINLSGTVGAACKAVQAGVPAIAFSGWTGSATAWNAPVPGYSTVYAALAAKVTKTLVDSGVPYLPADVWLNVNFPASSDSECASPDDFAFVLSRIYPAVPLVTPKDVQTCGNRGYLPTETDVVLSHGCYASISVSKASTKLTAGAADQQVVLEKLGGLLSCLP